MAAILPFQSSILLKIFFNLVIMRHHVLCSQTWWRHQMEIFSMLLALCAGNPPVTDGFPSQRPVKRSFNVLFDLRLNKRLSKESRRCWFETPSRSLWRQCNVFTGWFHSVSSWPINFNYFHTMIFNYRAACNVDTPSLPLFLRLLMNLLNHSFLTCTLGKFAKFG